MSKQVFCITRQMDADSADVLMEHFARVFGRSADDSQVEQEIGEMARMANGVPHPQHRIRTQQSVVNRILRMLMQQRNIPYTED